MEGWEGERDASLSFTEMTIDPGHHCSPNIRKGSAGNCIASTRRSSFFAVSP